MKEILLNHGIVAIVDDCHFEELSKYKWFAHKYGSKYRVVRSGSRRKGEVRAMYYMHRQLLGITNPKVVIDHINGNALDNRICNLRACSQSENSKNQSRPINNTTGYKGVVWDKVNKKYAAQIKINRKCKKIGRFHCIVEAAKAYDEAAKKYFGEFANLNFPEHEIAA